MVITQIINVPRATQNGHNSSYKYTHAHHTHLLKRTSKSPQTQLTRTSNTPQTHFKRISKTLRLLGFCNFMPPQSRVFFLFFENRSFFPLHKAPFAPHSRCKFNFFEIDRFPHCMKAPPPHPRSRGNFEFLEIGRFPLHKRPPAVPEPRTRRPTKVKQGRTESRRQPKVVITQIITVPKGARSRVYRALGQLRSPPHPPPPSACKTTKVRTRKSVGFSFTLTCADLASIRVEAVVVELVHDKHTKNPKPKT